MSIVSLLIAKLSMFISQPFKTHLSKKASKAACYLATSITHKPVTRITFMTLRNLQADRMPRKL